MTFLQTLDEAWPGSYKIASYMDELAAAQAPGYSWPTTIIVLLLLLGFMFYINRIVLAATLSFRTLFNGSKLQDICENQTSLSSVNITCLFCLLMVLMTVYSHGWTAMSLPGLAIAFLAYLVFRSLAFRFVDWYKDGSGIFGTIGNCGRVMLIVALVLSLPAVLLPLLFGAEVENFARYGFAAIFALCFAIYCTRACRCLLESGFSIYFCFLYLCALEFLPAGLLISAIVSL